MRKPKTVGVIPARYSSTRLPGKPLADICGRPMVWWVYQRVMEAKGLDEIYVATDDKRIKKTCEDYEIPVVMTMNDHRTAANRLYEVSRKVEADLYLQLNGDEPLINTEAVSAAILEDFPLDTEFGVNIITPIQSVNQLNDPSNIKVVFDQDMNALYMSRTPIPMPFRDTAIVYYKHVGIIGYNRRMLQFYNDSVPGRLESIEGIDTLRFLDYGKKLKLVIVEDCDSLSVDTPKDLDEVRQIIRNQMYEEK